MKEKFMRILSPVTIAVVAILDVAVIGYGIFAIKKIIQAIDKSTVCKYLVHPKSQNGQE